MFPVTAATTTEVIMAQEPHFNDVFDVDTSQSKYDVEEPIEPKEPTETIRAGARMIHQNHITSLPVRIASPSPARFNLDSNDLEPLAKLDFDAVRKRAAKKKRNKRKHGHVPNAAHVVKGFQTPTSCPEDSDRSGASTPYFGPMTSSPALRPATPSGFSALRLQLDALNLGNRTTPPRSVLMQRAISGSATSEAASDSDLTEMDSYEIPLTHDFVYPDRALGQSGVATPQLYHRPQEQQKVVSADEFSPITCLGKGSYGTVILVKQKTTGRLFAQKQFKKASLVVRKRLIEQTKTERDILKSVRHPFIVKLYYAFQDHEKLYLMLEYAQGGELFHHLSSEHMFPEETVRFYMAELVLALEHLHKHVGVVYRDLKPENCLLDAEGHLLLTDFGLSKVALDEADKCTSFTGTVEFMAPEVIQGKEYGMAVDWWSFGALGHDLLLGRPPFTGPNNAIIQQRIVKAKLVLPFHVGPDAKDLLIRLLRKDPSKRLGSNLNKDIPIIKAHRFFKGIDWRRLERRELVPPIQPIITNPELAENFATEFTDTTLSPKASRQSTLQDGWGPDADVEMGEDPFGGFSFKASASFFEGGILGYAST
jgi:serine/threonine protein kinase